MYSTEHKYLVLSMKNMLATMHFHHLELYTDPTLGGAVGFLHVISLL